MTPDSNIEIWRPIAGFPLYRVSDQGRVQNAESGRVLRPQPVTSRFSDRKYLFVSLINRDMPRRDGRIAHVSKTVHGLVAAAFLGERPEGYHVNHRNGDKTLNDVENLEYCTAAENVEHAIAHGLMEEHDLFRRRLSDDDVRAIRLEYAQGEISQPALGRKYGVTDSCICDIVNFKQRRNVR